MVLPMFERTFSRRGKSPSGSDEGDPRSGGMSMNEQRFQDLGTALIHRGIAGRHARQAVRDLERRFQQFVAEAQARGAGHRTGGTPVTAKLGAGVDRIAHWILWSPGDLERSPGDKPQAPPTGLLSPGCSPNSPSQSKRSPTFSAPPPSCLKSAPCRIRLWAARRLLRSIAG